MSERDEFEALKPCPFCGGPVKLERATDTRSEIYGVRKWWGVVCRNTSNLGGTCCIQQIPSASEEAAIERWNRRATPQQGVPALTDGWTLVPVEATDAMLIELARGQCVFDGVLAESYKPFVRKWWADLLAAAPQPSQEPEKASQRYQD